MPDIKKMLAIKVRAVPKRMREARVMSDHGGNKSGFFAT